MNKITISEKDYRELVETKLRYKYMRDLVEGDLFSAPPIKNVNEVIQSFKNTKKYKNSFLKSIEKGLKRSSFFK